MKNWGSDREREVRGKLEDGHDAAEKGQGQSAGLNESKGKR